jgi:hypothetical protein
MRKTLVMLTLVGLLAACGATPTNPVFPGQPSANVVASQVDEVAAIQKAYAEDKDLVLKESLGKTLKVSGVLMVERSGNDVSVYIAKADGSAKALVKKSTYPREMLANNYVASLPANKNVEVFLTVSNSIRNTNGSAFSAVEIKEMK